MRLVCPNCGAQYEVDDQVIPAEGRDVQCSNCGHTWFQIPKGRDSNAGSAQVIPAEAETVKAEPAQAEAAAEETATGKTATAGVAEGTGMDVEIEETDSTDPETSMTEDAEAEDAESETAAPRAMPRRELDESLREILRAEAAREAEARARARESSSLETQEELGLEPPAPAHPEPDADQTAPAAQEDTAGPDTAAQARTAHLRTPDSGDDSTTASGGAGARRDLLPDIDEINSSLESVRAIDIIDDFTDTGQAGNGFARGFVLALLVAVLLVVLYLYAPLIGQKIPPLAPLMDGWVNLADGARGWADRLVSGALALVQ